MRQILDEMTVSHWFIRLCPLLAISIGVSLLAVPIEAAKRTNGGEKARETSQDPHEAMLVDPVLKFGSKLLRKMGTNKNNTVFSPFAIHSALNLVLLGAKTASETQMELLKALGYTDCEFKDNQAQKAYGHLFGEIQDLEKKDELFRMFKEQLKKSPLGKMQKHVKMDIWARIISKGAHDKPLPDYKDLIAKYHNSSVEMAKDSSQVMDEINKWAKSAGFDKGVIEASELKDDFNLMLLSAARIESKWMTSFMKNKGTFFNHGLKSQSIEAKFLTNENTQIHYVNFSTSDNVNQEKVKSNDFFKQLSKLDFHAVDIPLVGSASLACFMPNKMGTGKELTQLESELLRIDEDGMLNLCKTFKVLDKSEALQNIGPLTLPKFTFGLNIDLKVPLQSMGLKRIFNETNSELTKMFEKPAWFQRVKHQAAISLSESNLKNRHGLWTAFFKKHHSISKLGIQLDHPFLFVVRYKRVPVLMGHLVKLDSK